MDGQPAFLLEPDLASSYLKEERRGDEGLVVMMGELDDLLFDLLDRQDGKDMRPIDSEIIFYPFAALWRLTLPGVDGLRARLDSNVPDEADDYTYADDAILELAHVVRRGIACIGAMREFLDVLADSGSLMDTAHVQAFLDNLSSFLANQPSWPNNGWAPREVRDHMDGDKDSSIVLESGWV